MNINDAIFSNFLTVFGVNQSEKLSLKSIGYSIHTHKDILAFILLETNFLSDNNDIKQIINEHPSSNSRSLITGLNIEFLHDQRLKHKLDLLFTLQKQWANSSAEMKSLEDKIQNIKDQIFKLI